MIKIQNFKVILEQIKFLEEMPFLEEKKIDYLGKYSYFKQDNYYIQYNNYNENPKKYNNYFTYFNKSNYIIPEENYIGTELFSYIKKYDYNSLDFSDELYRVYKNGEIYTSNTKIVNGNFCDGVAEDYQVYGETIRTSDETTIITKEGVSPLTFTTSGSFEVINYRIYGNSLENLFDSQIEQGTITKNGGFKTSSDYRVRTKDYINLRSGQYTLSSSQSLWCAIFIYKNGNYIKRINLSDNGDRLPYSFEIEDNYDILIAFAKTAFTEASVAISPSETFNFTIKSDNEMVGDKTKNLFDINSPNITKHHYYDTNGIEHESMYHDCSEYIHCKSGVTYTLSFYSKKMYYGVFVNLWSDQKQFIANLSNSGTITELGLLTYTFTPSQNGFITFNFLYDSGYMEDIMLNEGSAPLPYKPYGYCIPIRINNITTNIFLNKQLKGPQSYRVSKNRLPLRGNAETTTINGVTFVNDGNGTITVSGTAGSNGAIYTINLAKEYVIPISVEQGGNGCMQLNNNRAFFDPNALDLTIGFYYNDTKIDDWSLTPTFRVNSGYIKMGGNTINKIQINVLGNKTIPETSISPAFYEDGTTTQVPFDSYTPYSENTADYIDFLTKKIVDGDGIETTIDLPNLFIYNGENTLTVDTVIPPSNILISYKKSDFSFNFLGEYGSYNSYIINTSPLTFISQVSPLIDFIIYGNTEIINNEEVGVGNLVTDTSSQYYEKYEIPVIIESSNIFTNYNNPSSYNGGGPVTSMVNDKIAIYERNNSTTYIKYVINTNAGIEYTVDYTLCQGMTAKFNGELNGTSAPVGGEVVIPQKREGQYSITFTANGKTSFIINIYTTGVAYYLYGLKIYQKNTYNFYLDEQLFKEDELVLSDTLTEIPITTQANNIFTVDTTVSPSKIKLFTGTENKYKIPILLNEKEIEDYILLSQSLKKVGTISDYFKYNSNNYNVFYNIKSLVLDGSEDWMVDSEKFYINTSFSNCIVNSPVYCDEIKSKILDNSLTEDIWISSEGKLCIIKDELPLTVNDIKNYLLSHRPVIYYQLNIPEKENIYLPPLLMEGNQDGTMKNNKIEVNTTITPSEIKVQNIKKYYTTAELQEILNNKTEGGIYV